MKIMRAGNDRSRWIIPALTIEKVEREKKKTKIGDIVECEVLTANFDQDGRYLTVKKRLPIVEKYKHIVRMYDGKTGRYHSISYIDLALQKRRKR